MKQAEELLALLEKADKDESGLPPVHQWQPERHADIDMRIARDGTWYYQNSPSSVNAWWHCFPPSCCAKAMTTS